VTSSVPALPIGDPRKGVASSGTGSRVLMAAVVAVVVVVVTGAGRPEAEVAERVAERRQGQVVGRPFTAAIQMPTGLRAGMRERRTVEMARPLVEEVLAGGA
jgi:hypothetical protein